MGLLCIWWYGFVSFFFFFRTWIKYRKRMSMDPRMWDQSERTQALTRSYPELSFNNLIPEGPEHVYHVCLSVCVIHSIRATGMGLLCIWWYGFVSFFFFFVDGLNIERECRWIPGCGINQKGHKPLRVHIPNLVLTI